MTEFKLLENELRKEAKDQLNKNLSKIETEEGLKQVLQWENKTYKGKVKEKIAKHLKKQIEKRLSKELNQLKEVSEAGEFSKLVVSLDWLPSRMWRSNPRAYTNYGFKGESVGGCGYDKQSTALAQGLNSYLPLMKLLYVKKNKELKVFNSNPEKKYKDVNGEKYYGRSQHNVNTELFGYGSGYNILPRFEGGVGYSSHKRIIESLGLEFEAVTQASNSDTFIISKKGNE